MKINRSAFLIFVSAALSLAQPAKLNIAVQELAGKGIDASSAGIISDRLRSEFINTGVFRVMERGEMENILKEQGFQKSGACDEASCLVEVGQLLGVERMVAGSIGKVGDFFTISLRMINVATGEILFTVNVDYKGSIEEVISRVTGDAALKLARSAGGEIAKAMTAGKKGDLYITTEPSGATVEIDGQKISGQTPLTLQGFPAGEHRIIARGYNHFGSKTITLEPDDLLKVQISMSEGEGCLKVFTTPAGATVLLDGVNKGQTPIKIEKVAAGEHSLRLEIRGYLLKDAAVSVNTDETANFSAIMEPAAYLTLTAKPLTATILINDHKAGTGQISAYEVAAGSVNIQVEAPGCDVYRITEKLSTGQTRKLDIQLVSSFATLEVTSDPPGAQVLINDKPAGTTPYSNDRLLPGAYKVRLELEGHDEYETEVEAVKAETKSVKAALVSKFGKLEVKSEPAGAYVFLNGQHSGQTPYTNFELEPGAYGLQLKLETYNDIFESIELSKGQTLKKEYNLEHTKQFIESLNAAKGVAKKKRQWARRIVFGVLAAGSGGLGAYFNTQAQEAIDRQQDIQAAYRAATTGFDAFQVDYDAEGETAAAKARGRTFTYVLCGIFGTGFVLSIPF
jgi:hypothetical protein